MTRGLGSLEPGDEERESGRGAERLKAGAQVSAKYGDAGAAHLLSAIAARSGEVECPAECPGTVRASGEVD